MVSSIFRSFFFMYLHLLLFNGVQKNITKVRELILKENARKKMLELNYSLGKWQKTASLSSWRKFLYWAPTRESYTTTIPTCSDSVSRPRTLSSFLPTSSEIPSHQTYRPRTKHTGLVWIEVWVTIICEY